jgi:hypothetical protein
MTEDDNAYEILKQKFDLGLAAEGTDNRIYWNVHDVQSPIMSEIALYISNIIYGDL